MEKNESIDYPSRLLSDEQIEQILHDEIYPHYFEAITPPEHPNLIYVAGQPGSGKSRYNQHITNKLEQREPNSTVGINCDDMRTYHPQFSSLQTHDDISAAIRINPDNARFTDSLIDMSVSVGCNVVLEGTFRNPISVESTANKYKLAGYRTSAIIVATHPAISRLGIIDRYLDEREENGVGRFTYSHIHDDTVAAIPDTIHHFIDSQLGTSLALVTRTGDELFSTDTTDMSRQEITMVAKEAKRIILQEHNRELSRAEYDFVSDAIQRNIDRALTTSAPSIVIDELQRLHTDIQRLQ